MTNTSLAARYRPQTFAQVVGQDMVKSILSRAALEDRVAPAYLLSGTRGVGKTTIARIFAKALNCGQAPTGEPCNECEACRRITQGSYVDVVEIDGASNRGIDDVRRLREAVGYAPLEGRYKVFIIDEAHMLTKEAFNALLKTLEEPPARVTFIMATTEQHKFPVTIVSRCQHFVFRQIPESTLEGHIVSVLNREGITFEPEAARLVARRAAGSVRDSMSLLGQALALSGADHGMASGTGSAPSLTAAQTRDVLGLVGQEVMERLLIALGNRDALAVSVLVRELLFQGADMGFFLRELGTLWRNLFLLRQAGPGADVGKALDMPEQELARLRELAHRFTLTFIHAAWQMTLDSQRRILTSLEPAAGLELLLLNLALLPRLLPLADLSSDQMAGPTGGHQENPEGNQGDTRREQPSGQGTYQNSAQKQPPTPKAPAGTPADRQEGEPENAPADVAADMPAAMSVDMQESMPADMPADMQADAAKGTLSPKAHNSPDPDDIPAWPTCPTWMDEVPHAAAPSMSEIHAAPPSPPFADSSYQPATSDAALFSGSAPRSKAPSFMPPPPPLTQTEQAMKESQGTQSRQTGSSSTLPFSSPTETGKSWDDFLAFCHEQDDILPLPMLRQFEGRIQGNEIHLQAHSQTMFNQIQRPTMLGALENLLARWAGRPLKLFFSAPSQQRLTSAELRDTMQEHPVVKALQTLYDGTLLRCTPIQQPRP